MIERIIIGILCAVIICLVILLINCSKTEQVTYSKAEQVIHKIIKDTIIIRDTLRIENTQAVLYFKKKYNQELIRSDSLQNELFLKKQYDIIAELDTIINEDSLNIKYYFPPVNTFFLDYRKKPIYLYRDKVFYVDKKNIWENIFWGVAGFSAGYTTAKIIK